jgi:isocitrate dehydrogenase
VEAAYTSVVSRKIVTYDFARQMEGAREVKTSEFAEAMVAAMR